MAPQTEQIMKSEKVQQKKNKKKNKKQSLKRKQKKASKHHPQLGKSTTENT